MKFSAHPVLKAPTPEVIKALCFNADGSTNKGGLEKLIEMHRMHEDAVANATADPLNFGITLQGWVYADSMLDLYDSVMCFGGNRSGKTEYGARSVVKAAIENPNSMCDSHLPCPTPAPCLSNKAPSKFVSSWRGFGLLTASTGWGLFWIF